MCKANHAAERSYAQCEITEQHVTRSTLTEPPAVRSPRLISSFIIMIMSAGGLVQSRRINKSLKYPEDELLSSV